MGRDLWSDWYLLGSCEREEKGRMVNNRMLVDRTQTAEHEAIQ